MFDFNAITNQNGWAMAVTGASIVFCGLVLLSLAVSQLHRIVGLIEKRPGDDVDSTSGNGQASAAGTPFPSVWPTDVRLSAELLDPLVTGLGPIFTMADLYAAASENELPHPHITFTQLRRDGILTPVGDGTFSWQR